MKKTNSEKTYATLKPGKTYKFAGYSWTACEVNNDRHVAVIQSHGITHGMWPGFVIPKFGNGNYYGRSIDGQDVSDYDEKMSALYNAIKDVEDKSASYGKDICNSNQRKITTDKQKSMAKIEKQRENARKLNELVCHLAKLLESDDKRYSFEFAAGGTMEIFDKIDKIGYAVHIEPIEYDADGNATNL